MKITDVGIRDVIALGVIGGGLYLVSQGINGTVGSILIMVTTYYFTRGRNRK